MVKNLTTKQVESIQIDEGLIFLNYGLPAQRLLAPTRGGGEFGATVTVRNVEFDGSQGETDVKVIESQGATLKVTTLDMSQENLALAVPNCVIEDDEGKTIRNPRSGFIRDDSYLDNVTMFAKTIGGKYKRITIYRALHKTGFTAKAVQKAEGELSLEFVANYRKEDLDGELWEVKDVTSYAAPSFVSAKTKSSSVLTITFNEELSSVGLTQNDFTVVQSDVEKQINGAALNGTDAKTIELAVSGLAAGKTITVAYTVGTLKGKNGIAVQSFTAQPVENTLT